MTQPGLPPPVPPSPSAKLLDQLKLFLAVFTALGVVAYGILRLAYLQFYSQFKAIPEEAGLGKAELLGQALVGPIVLALVVCVLIVAVLFIVTAANILYAAALSAGLGRPVKWACEQLLQSHPKRDELLKRLDEILALPSFREWLLWVRRSWLRLASGALAISVVLIIVAMFMFANTSAEDVMTGRHQSLQGQYAAIGSFSLPLLEVRALPADVEWTGADESEPSSIPFAGDCLMYLGETEDRLLLYDALHSRTLRVSRDSMAISIRTLDSELPETCS